MKKLRFNKTPVQGQWVCDVKGFGELAVVHNTHMIFDKDTGKVSLKDDYNYFNPVVNGRTYKGKAARWIDRFNAMDFVLIQKDGPEGERNGYVGVVYIKNKTLDETGYTFDVIEFVARP